MSWIGKQLRRLRQRWGFHLGILLLLSVLVVLALFHRIFINIEAGHGGVLWRRFFGGTQLDASYPEGLRVIFPWDRMTVYDLRLQQKPISMRYYKLSFCRTRFLGRAEYSKTASSRAMTVV